MCSHGFCVCVCVCVLFLFVVSVFIFVFASVFLKNIFTLPSLGRMFLLGKDFQVGGYFSSPFIHANPSSGFICFSWRVSWQCCCCCCRMEGGIFVLSWVLTSFFLGCSLWSHCHGSFISFDSYLCSEVVLPILCFLYFVGSHWTFVPYLLCLLGFCIFWTVSLCVV